MQSWRLLFLLLLGLLPLLFLHACGGNALAPVEAPGTHAQKTAPAGKPAPAQTARTPAPRPEPAPAPKKGPEAAPARMPAYHVVTRGETLYSIVWRYGLDYRDVAAWNKIHPPYLIHPGQRINLNGKPVSVPTYGSRTGRTSDASRATGPVNIKIKPGADSTLTEPVPDPTDSTPQTPPLDNAMTWSWPAQGSIVTTDSPIAKNGIDIAGKRGQQVNASAPGEVVYSGSGLLGYGRLIIIKHNDIYLSAYAHNSELLVQEGERVKGGQNIALMGEAANGKALLHFEIRKNGQPVDPLKYLPRIN